MKSLAEMIADLQTLKAGDLSAWEQSFMGTIKKMTRGSGESTVFISGKQAEVINRLWKKHYQQ